MITVIVHGSWKCNQKCRTFFKYGSNLNLFTSTRFCVCMKRVTVCNYLCSSSSLFSAGRVREIGIVSRYSWFWKFLKMAEQGCGFSLFSVIHVRIDIRIDTSIIIRNMTTKFCQQAHLEEMTQVRLIKQVLVKFSRQHHVTNYKHISTTRMLMTTKLGRMVTYPYGLLPIKSHDALIWWSCEITWQTKNIKSPLPHCLWPQNVLGCWITLSGFYP